MTRGQEIKAERRRRTTVSGNRRNLTVDESKLDRANYVYRFANDTGNRIHDLTVNDDWDVVQGQEKSAGTDKEGRAMKAVLLRKRKDFHNDDQAAKQRQIDEMEAAMRSKADPSGGSSEGSYVPGGKSSPTDIRRG